MGLIRQLRDEAKSLIRNEVQLAKTELGEKFGAYGRNAVWLAIGGFVAYAGVVVLFGGIGFLLAYAFQAGAGMNPLLAMFLGLLLAGIMVAAVGGMFILSALKAFRQETLKPERTIYTIKEMKSSETMPPGAELVAENKTEEAPKASSEQLQDRVETTLVNMEETTAEIRDRLSPRHMRDTVEHKIQEHPLSSSLIAASAGLCGFLLFWRKLRPARAH
jgi:ElaB/YqjD/DUF883 family membrane-anchored ribosome-binding protein